MGRLGLANDRRTSIPWEINDDDGVMKIDKNIVLHKWKTVYEQLFYQEQDHLLFDNEHLNTVKEVIHYPDNPAFPSTDCSMLNLPISREEVRMSIYNAKAGKACGDDKIPAEILRNDNCIDMLFRIIRYCFDICGHSEPPLIRLVRS